MVSFSLRQRISSLLLQDPTPVSFHLSQFVSPDGIFSPLAGTMRLEGRCRYSRGHIAGSLRPCCLFPAPETGFPELRYPAKRGVLGQPGVPDDQGVFLLTHSIIRRWPWPWATCQPRSPSQEERRS